MDNLELFPMGLLLNLDMYRKIGRNAALYTRGDQPPTIPTIWDQHIIQLRARAEPIVVMLQHIEEKKIIKDKDCTELEVEFIHLQEGEK